MKKIKVSGRLKNKSAGFLKNYLNSKRKRPLTVKIKKEIKKVIKKKEKGLDKFSKDIIKSPLFTLAVSEIIREGHSKKILINGEEKYDIHPAEIMLMMLNIVDIAHRQGQKEKLDDYCITKK